MYDKCQVTVYRIKTEFLRNVVRIIIDKILCNVTILLLLLILLNYMNILYVRIICCVS